MIIRLGKKAIIGGAITLGVGYQQKKDYDNRKTLALEFLVDRPSIDEDDDFSITIIDETQDSLKTPIRFENAIDSERLRKEEQMKLMFGVGTPTKEELHKLLQQDLTKIR